MKRLDLYLGKSVFSATLLVWLVVSILDALFVLLGQLADIGRGDYSLTDAVLFVLLGLPMRAWQAFPVAVLIGAVLGLGNLAAHRELNAFRLAGCSTLRLTRATMYTGVLLIATALLLGEGWAPHSQKLAQQLRSQAIYEDVSLQRDAGFWVRDGRRFIQVHRSEVDGSLSRVNIYQLAAGSRLQKATGALSARPQSGDWLLKDVSVSEFHDQRIAVEHRDEVRWSHLIDVRLAQLLTRDASTLSLSRLREYIDYLQSDAGDVLAYRLNYWQRLAAPVSALTMLLLGVALVLGPLAGRTLGQRLMVAVLAGLAFDLLADIIAHAGLVYGVSPLLSAFVPSLLVLSIAGAVVSKA
jgi:lipopolysaccharide export system permease protein